MRIQEKRKKERGDLLLERRYFYFVVLTMRRLLFLSLLAGCLQLVPAADDGEKEDVGTVIGIDLGTTYSW